MGEDRNLGCRDLRLWVQRKCGPSPDCGLPLPHAGPHRLPTSWAKAAKAFIPTLVPKTNCCACNRYATRGLTMCCLCLTLASGCPHLLKQGRDHCRRVGGRPAALAPAVDQCDGCTAGRVGPHIQPEGCHGCIQSGAGGEREGACLATGVSDGGADHVARSIAYLGIDNRSAFLCCDTRRITLLHPCKLLSLALCQDLCRRPRCTSSQTVMPTPAITKCVCAPCC